MPDTQRPGSYISGCRNNSQLAMFSYVYGDRMNKTRIHVSVPNSVVAIIITVTVGIAFATVAAMFPAAVLAMFTVTGSISPAEK